MTVTNVVSRQELIDAANDVETLEQVVNGSATLNGDGTLSSRLGTSLKTLAKIIEDLAAKEIGDDAAALINARLDVLIAEAGSTIPTDTPFIADGKLWINEIGISVDAPTPLTEANLEAAGFSRFQDTSTKFETVKKLPSAGEGRRGDVRMMAEDTIYGGMVFVAFRDPTVWIYFGQTFIPKFEQKPKQAMLDKIATKLTFADVFKYELINQPLQEENGVYSVLQNSSSIRESFGPYYRRQSSVGVTKIYADSTATGVDSGGSWDNAFTDLQDALDAMSDDCILYTNSTRSNPFIGEFTVDTNLRNITIITDQGPDDETWFSGARKTTWSDLGGGLFSTPVVAEPSHVVYDFKQDDNAGTVTNCDLTDSKVVAANEKFAWDQNDQKAWYGFLIKNTVSPTNPGNGEWGWLAGNLYVNPPGSPILSEVNTKTEYVPGDENALNISNHYSTVRGRMIAYLYCDDSTDKGCAVAASGDSGMDIGGVMSIACPTTVRIGIANNYYNKIKNCFSNCSEGNAFVLRKTGGSEYVIATGENLCSVKYPFLAHDGRSLSATVPTGAACYANNTAGTTAYNHFRKVLLLDFYGDVLLRAGGDFPVYSDKRGSLFLVDNHINPAASFTRSSYLNSLFDSHAVGMGASPSYAIYYRDCVMDRRGTGDPTSAVYESASHLRNIFDRTTIYTGNCRCFIANIDTNDYFIFEGCDIIGGSETAGDKQGIFECNDAAAAKLFLLETNVSLEAGKTGFNSLYRGLSAAATTTLVDFIDSRLSTYALPGMVQDFDGVTLHDFAWWRANMRYNTKDRFIAS